MSSMNCHKGEYSCNAFESMYCALETDRDLWKYKAENLAEALKSIIRYFGDNTTLQSRIAKEALAEFEK